jgi:DNA-binding Lrp family transcriptional regulator
VRSRSKAIDLLGAGVIGNMFLQEARPMRQFTRAFVLIQTEPMKEREVIEELTKMDEVVEAHMITGEYDILAVVQVKRMFLEADYDNVFNSAIAKIESAKYVLDTNSIIGMASKTKISEST